MVTTNAVREHPIEPGLDGSDIDDTGIRDSGWDDSYWGPGDPDFGTATPPRFTFADPHAAGLFHADDEHVSIHNRGTGSAAALIFLDDGRVELRRLGPGETITLPDEDSFTYLQAPRGDDGRPVVYGGVWVHQGRAMPVTIPIPSEREFLAQRYLTPWSTDWVGGLAGCRLRDPAEDHISYQYRSGGTTFTVRNAGDTWVAVVHRAGSEYTVVECGPHERVDFSISPHSAHSDVFSVVGPRLDGSPGRAPYVSASGTVHPGWAGRPGAATAYGSVVIMLGSLMYSALPKRNLYLAFSDRRRGCGRVHR
ncbi:hypothetical protein [Gordonia westfalica]|uniref:Uncharacterized protein n=1 Tax=Gordonia westfalica TaxID=158898 RepID=A0A1H2LMZ6_9ACTN|nr:hypothetical protein [Gordonia westfalica]SDU81961.1 hypothetical protein SAMN04488548_136586 [Gordonia westfalica]